MKTGCPELGWCEALLDQGHYIGDDPVGHACYLPATRVVRLLHSEVALYRVCESCFAWLQDPEKAARVSVYTPFVGLQNPSFLNEVKSEPIIQFLKQQEAGKVRRCLRNLLSNAAQATTDH
jgi:hypothetical protein